MKLNFKSLINQNDELKTIQFTVPVETHHNDTFKVFVFDEPNTNTKSMIEVSEQEINIHTSTSSIFLKYNQEFEFNYVVNDQGKEFLLPCITNWTEKEFSDNKFVFKYFLKTKDTHIGEFEITLELTDN
ncbi:hypothetical protein MBVR141_0495 [Mycoplasmopsis bovirhinis]|uniref:Glutamyl-tRNA synthetase n=1 Tax=Mycoplasmopsis bovirhinis TaxID=29553 RepID=A0A224AZ87_9BACT|nr:DUF1934 family protein [Mycoplasmopsis bovirhinis]BBA22334.1 hypothetical protein MBVR141_0495 [Mycoplasmopsis bovirhinis]VEU62987.1 glutamyl-tRNA synthetase [Mycoplasmopsis bovirhinis]